MNKARLEWVMSGLNQYVLTVAETLFLETVSADFERNQALTERQEERLETLYKEKSRLTPNKKLKPLPITKSTFKKWMLHKFEWDDSTGAIWRQVTDGTGRKDAFWAYGSLYCELANHSSGI